MNKIKIMTDSASDIPKELEEKYDIKILCFPITVGDKGYTERVDFTNEEFYHLLLNVPKIPVTSQITSVIYSEEFKKVYEQGYNELIYVSINSKGSNTYNSALMGREMFYDENPQAKEEFQIHIVDSKTYTMAYGYAVIEAAKKASKGAKSSEILAFLQDWFDSVVVYFSPLKLDFAKKSGRISCAAAFVGELIGLKPVIRIMDGEMDIVDKVRGERAIAPALVKYAKDTMIPKTPYFTVKGLSETQSNELVECAKKEIGDDPIGTFEVGSCIAINAGPQVVGIMVKGVNRNIQTK
jgi:DegV family protein with EDD domain